MHHHTYNKQGVQQATHTTVWKDNIGVVDAPVVPATWYPTHPSVTAASDPFANCTSCYHFNWECATRGSCVRVLSKTTTHAGHSTPHSVGVRAVQRSIEPQLKSATIETGTPSHFPRLATVTAPAVSCNVSTTLAAFAAGTRVTNVLRAKLTSQLQWAEPRAHLLTHNGCTCRLLSPSRLLCVV